MISSKNLIKLDPFEHIYLLLHRVTCNPYNSLRNYSNHQRKGRAIKMIDLSVHEQQLENAIQRARDQNIILPTFE
ncbi:MAG: hypothetical protein ACXAD7_27595, partial [Candidatus Kariarchaeaceae archaeon]